MFGMPKSCELRRGRRLITVAGSMTTTAALKEMSACLRRTGPAGSTRANPSRHQTSLAISSPLQMRRGLARLDPGSWLPLAISRSLIRGPRKRECDYANLGLTICNPEHQAIFTNGTVFQSSI
jgi:hypothetical protein